MKSSLKASRLMTNSSSTLAMEEKQRSGILCFLLVASLAAECSSVGRALAGSRKVSGSMLYSGISMLSLYEKILIADFPLDLHSTSFSSLWLCRD